MMGTVRGKRYAGIRPGRTIMRGHLMAQPAQQPDPFHDEEGYLLSVETAAMHAIHVQHGWTTPAREARRMLQGGDPRYVAMAQTWLREHGLPETGDTEPPGWEHWQEDYWAGRTYLMAVPATLSEAIRGCPCGREDKAVCPQHQPPRKVRAEVPPGSRLESLLSQQSEAKARLAAAEDWMDAIKAGVQAELTAVYPGVPKFDIPAGPGWDDLTLYYSEPNYFDQKRFKVEQPDLYGNYLKPSPRWTFGKPNKKGDN